MSLFALLSTAVAIPLGVACFTFIFFYLRARSVDRNRARYEQRKSERQAARVAMPGEPAAPAELTVGAPAAPMTAAADSMPAFRPLSYYLETNGVAFPTEHPISELPGLDDGLQRALRQLGYTSIEQVAQWGRADVRAVSAMLGIDQRLIEDGWVPSARQLLSTA